MRYGVNVPNLGDLETLLGLGVEAERAGWDGFFVWDEMRFQRGSAVPLHDPWVLLAALAERTERIRLGTMVTPLPRRRPWKLARETVTLDHLSGGRLILGVGLGYPADADFEFLGEDPDDRVRAGKLDEGLEVLERCWSGQGFDFEGEHFHVREARFLPTPLQRPRIPVWVGGMWPNPAPFRRAARWDGVVPIMIRPDGEVDLLDAQGFGQALAYVLEHRSAEGRFDAVASGIANGNPEIVRPFEDAGATWWLETDEGVEGREGRMLERIRSGPPR